MMTVINELIEQIGGRERLEELASFKPSGSNSVNSASREEWMEMALALLAVLEAKPKYFMRVDEDFGLEINSINEFSGGGEGIALYTTPPAASAPDGWLLIPAIPSQSHLNSIAMRYSHDFYLLPDNQRESVLSTARQMYEECSGQGFYSIPKPAAPAPGGDGG